MLLGGVWHGANWTFVAWGGLHGLYLSINHGFRRLTLPVRWARPWRIVAWAMTLGAVLLAWVFFRAADFTTAFAMLQAMFGRNGIVLPSAAAPLAAVAPGLVRRLDISFGGLAILAAGGPYNLGWLPIAASICLLAPNLADWLSAWQLAIGHPVVERATAVVPAWRPDLGWGLVTGLLLASCVVYQTSAVRFLYFQF
jgi:hypothetical protein